MPKNNNPYLIPEKIEKQKLVEEVRELTETPWWQEYQSQVNKSPLSPAAHGKVISKSGSNLQSGKEGYGPMLIDREFKEGMKRMAEREKWHEEKKRRGVCTNNCCEERSKWEWGNNKLCDKHYEESKNGERLAKWVFKASTAAVAGWYLGPVAFEVGGLTWGTTKIIEKTIDNENMKEVLRFIGDIGWDTAKGAFIGKLIGVSEDSLASKATQEIGHHAAAEISANGGKIPSDVENIIDLGRLISFGQQKYKLYDKYGKPTCELARHEYHKNQGRSYDSDCEVCKA